MPLISDTSASGLNEITDDEPCVDEPSGGDGPISLWQHSPLVDLYNQCVADELELCELLNQNAATDNEGADQVYVDQLFANTPRHRRRGRAASRVTLGEDNNLVMAPGSGHGQKSQSHASP